MQTESSRRTDAETARPGGQAGRVVTALVYLGCLGSTRTHAKRVARLTEAGFTEADTARIHAPVGLDIGARSPGEIAVAVLAQVTEVLRKG